jgi:hypothetical protein
VRFRKDTVNLKPGKGLISRAQKRAYLVFGDQMPKVPGH